jgi:hypothetical protein
MLLVCYEMNLLDHLHSRLQEKYQGTQCGILILKCGVQPNLFYLEISDGWVGCGRAQLPHPENLKHFINH